MNRHPQSRVPLLLRLHLSLPRQSRLRRQKMCPPALELLATHLLPRRWAIPQHGGTCFRTSSSRPSIRPWRRNLRQPASLLQQARPGVQRARARHASRQMQPDSRALANRLRQRMRHHPARPSCDRAPSRQGRKRLSERRQAPSPVRRLRPGRHRASASIGTILAGPSRALASSRPHGARSVISCERQSRAGLAGT